MSRWADGSFVTQVSPSALVWAGHYPSVFKKCLGVKEDGCAGLQGFITSKYSGNGFSLALQLGWLTVLSLPCSVPSQSSLASYHSPMTANCECILMTWYKSCRELLVSWVMSFDLSGRHVPLSWQKNSGVRLNAADRRRLMRHPRIPRLQAPCQQTITDRRCWPSIHTSCMHLVIIPPRLNFLGLQIHSLLNWFVTGSSVYMEQLLKCIDREN